MVPHKLDTPSDSDSEGSPFLVDAASLDSEGKQVIPTTRDNDQNVHSNNEPIAIVGIGKLLFNHSMVGWTGPDS